MPKCVLTFGQVYRILNKLHFFKIKNKHKFGVQPLNYLLWNPKNLITHWSSLTYLKTWLMSIYITHNFLHPFLCNVYSINCTPFYFFGNFMLQLQLLHMSNITYVIVKTWTTLWLHHWTQDFYLAYCLTKRTLWAFSFRLEHSLYINLEVVMNYLLIYLSPINKCIASFGCMTNKPQHKLVVYHDKSSHV